MKRIGAIVSLSLLIVLLVSTTLCFAADLEIIDTYPKEAQHNLQPTNCGVKLWFSENMYAPENFDVVSKCFKIVDGDGKTVPSTVNWGEKEKNMILVLANKDLVVNSTYKLYVSDELISANGDALGESMELTFGTRDTSKDMTANMIMMGLMFAGMLFFSSKAMKKQTEKAAKESDDKVNPYKIAKETGKSVEEVMEKLEKEKQKKAKAQAKKNASRKSSDDDDDADYDTDNDNKRVSAARPISAAGSTYITGRKAKAEAKAKAAAAAKAKAEAKAAAKGTTNPKKKSNKSKKK